MTDPLSLALTHINRADKLLEEIRKFASENDCYKKKAEEEKKNVVEIIKKELDLHGFTTRMKNFPSLITEAGTIPALTFYLSKVGVDEDMLKKLYLYFNNEEGGLPVPSGCNDSLLDEVSKKESAGYAIAVAMLLSAVNKLADVEFNTNNFLLDVLDKLKRLLEDSTKRFELEYNLGAYSIEAKKLVEAFSKARWEVEEQ